MATSDSTNKLIIQEGISRHQVDHHHVGSDGARGPDAIVDLAENAPELDQSVYAPHPFPVSNDLQIAFGTEPELLRGDGLHSHERKSSLQEKMLDDENAHFFCTRIRRKWIFGGIVMLLFAVALGVGLSVGLSRRIVQDKASPVPLEPNPSPVPLVHGALSDTSLAAILDNVGDKHLFFQDINGTLRHAIFSISTNQWLSNMQYLITPSSPRNHTPISVIRQSLDPDDPSLAIFYVQTNNTVVQVSWSAQTGVSRPTSPENDGTLSVPTASRSLGAALLPSHNIINLLDPNGTVIGTASGYAALVFFENSNNRLTALMATAYEPQSCCANGTDPFRSLWQNVSDTFNGGFRPGNWPTAPFGTFTDSNNGWSGLYMNGQFLTDNSVPAMLSSGGSLSALAINSSMISPTNPTNPLDGTALVELVGLSPSQLGISAAAEQAFLTGQSDLLNMWSHICAVGNGTLSCDAHGSPDSPFPFARLAYTYSNNVTSSVFHQLNESVLLEEVLDWSLGPAGWGKTVSIPVPVG